MSRTLTAALLLGYCGIVASAEMSARIIVGQAPLAGFIYYEGVNVWDQIRKGDTLTLVREPANPHDAQAIRLDWRGHKLGYVPRKHNRDLARQMDHGTQPVATVTELTKAANGRHRIGYEITVPLRP